MNFFEILLINFILITFPLTLYLFYVAYNTNIGKGENGFVYNITLLTSLFLITKFGVVLHYSSIIIVVAPLIIAYYKKDYFTISLLSVILIIYDYMVYHFNLPLLFIEYILYLALSFFFNSKKEKFPYFLVLLMVLKVLFTIIMLSLTTTNPVGEIVFRTILLGLNALIITIFALILLNKGEDIMKYHMSIKKLEKEKQIRTSLFKITHEIKNPLAVCKGYLDMLDTKDNKQVEKYIPIIKSEIDKTLVLLQDFLCMNKEKFVKEPMDINLLIEDVVDSFESIFKNKKIRCNLCLLDDEIYINGDYNRLTQVFTNIIKNSIEAMDKKDAMIEVKTFIENGYFQTIVEDNGCGINADVLKKISEPFFTTKKNGTGLGVSLSKEILNAHKATMEYNSEEGSWTMVKILIPIEKGAN